jgi:galactokinase
MTARELSESFYSRYRKPARVFYAPGRVNLIGEHTDYNEGFVMPFALDRGTSVAAAARQDRLVRVHSQNLDSSAEFDLNAAEPLRRGTWVDYIQGMARALEHSGIRLSGADLLISSDLPSGAGLSSSAALEVSVGKALSAISGQAVHPMDLVQAAHRTETEYVGTQSGIMDQYIATFGIKDCCLLIDCRSLDSKPLPLETKDIAFILADTAVKHELATTAYNQRRDECREGVQHLKRQFPGTRALRDVSPTQFRQVETLLPPPVRQRCRHVIGEIQRTLDAAEALSAHDYKRLGLLMYESHRSLQYDYEVSIPQLDLLVETARQTEGVLGSRMTGGGFGGCTITLVRRDRTNAFMEACSVAYQAAFAAPPGFIDAKASGGAVELETK